MGEKKENKRPIIILPYFMQIHVQDTKTAWESRFYRESAQVPLSSENYSADINNVIYNADGNSLCYY